MPSILLPGSGFLRDTHPILSNLHRFVYLLSLPMQQNRSTMRSGILYKFFTFFFFLSPPSSIYSLLGSELLLLGVEVEIDATNSKIFSRSFPEAFSIRR